MRINKHLVAIDLDGTLLNDEKTITPFSIKVLKELEKEGHKIVLTTGRALRSVKRFHELIGLVESPIICYNGHLILNVHDSEFKEISFTLNPKTIRDVYKDLMKENLIQGAMSESSTTIYADNDDDFLFAFYDKHNMVYKHGPLDENIYEPIYTCVFKYDDSNPFVRDKITKVVNKYNDVKVRFWFGGEYCELYIEGVSKSRAISLAASYYNISRENIIVFGDADNDIEMLRDYKNSYLMKNGNPILYDIAHNITEYTNNQDGVARKLLEILVDNTKD